MFDIAVLGFGVVGSGVVEVIDKNADRITKNAAQEIRVKYIVDVRDFPDSPYRSLLIKDFAVVEKDPDIKVVVETIGGVGVAYDYTRRSLLAGKSVVTSNKELVATHGYELIKIAQEKGVNYLFEASVGGGIPILRPITQCLAANKINEIYGILNGTTNFILTEMIKSGVTFQEALSDAQEKGYAEADPSADISGKDACRKICILSALCFGFHLYPEQVPTEGITGVTFRDVDYARKLDCKIKLLGRAACLPDGRVAAYVAPHFVSRENLLSAVEGVMNGIVVRGNAIGDVMFYGAGAGKFPTASAVVADVIDAAKHVHARKYIDWDEGSPDKVADPAILETEWFVRTEAPCDVVKTALGDVEACLISEPKDGETVFKTGALSQQKLDALLRGISISAAYRILD